MAADDAQLLRDLAERLPAGLLQRLRDTAGANPDPEAVELLLSALDQDAHEAGRGEDADLLIAQTAVALGSRATARLYENARRRLAWLSASVEVTETLLGAEPRDALQLVASGARSLTGGTIASIEVPVGDDSIRIEAYDGPAADEVRGRVVTVDESPLYRTVAESLKPLLIETARDPRVLSSPALVGAAVGSVLVVPLLAGGKPLGALIVANDPAATPFRTADVELARTFGSHAGLVLEFVSAQRDRRRVAVIEDRERIAADLSEGVINRLFAVGMQLSSLAPTIPGPAAANLLRVVNQLDDVIAELRSAVFALQETFAALRPAQPEPRRLNERITQLLQDAGLQTTLRLDGAAEAMAGAATVDLLAAVLQTTLRRLQSRGSRDTVDPVDIVVKADEGEIALSIEGPSLPASAADADPTWSALVGRVATAGGRLQMRTADGAGVRVECSLPA